MRILRSSVYLLIFLGLFLSISGYTVFSYIQIGCKEQDDLLQKISLYSDRSQTGWLKVDLNPNNSAELGRSYVSKLQISSIENTELEGKYFKNDFYALAELPSWGLYKINVEFDEKGQVNWNNDVLFSCRNSSNNKKFTGYKIFFSRFHWVKIRYVNTQGHALLKFHVKQKTTGSKPVIFHPLSIGTPLSQLSTEFHDLSQIALKNRIDLFLRSLKWFFFCFLLTLFPFLLRTTLFIYQTFRADPWFALIFLFILPVQFWCLSGQGPNDGDEILYHENAQKTLEYLQNHDWIKTPFRNFFLHFVPLTHYAKPVYHLLLLASYGLAGIHHYSGVLVTCFSGVVILLLIYLIGIRIADKNTARVAMIFCAFSSYFLTYSRMGIAHQPSLAFATLAFYLFIKGIQDGKTAKLLLLSGFSLGLGVGCHPSIGIMIIPFGLSCFLDYFGKRFLTRLNYLFFFILGFLLFIGLMDLGFRMIDNPSNPLAANFDLSYLGIMTGHKHSAGLGGVQPLDFFLEILSREGILHWLPLIFGIIVIFWRYVMKKEQNKFQVLLVSFLLFPILYFWLDTKMGDLERNVYGIVPAQNLLAAVGLIWFGRFLFLKRVRFLVSMLLTAYVTVQLPSTIYLTTYQDRLYRSVQELNKRCIDKAFVATSLFRNTLSLYLENKLRFSNLKQVKFIPYTASLSADLKKNSDIQYVIFSDAKEIEGLKLLGSPVEIPAFVETPLFNICRELPFPIRKELIMYYLIPEKIYLAPVESETT